MIGMAKTCAIVSSLMLPLDGWIYHNGGNDQGGLTQWWMLLYLLLSTVMRRRMDSNEYPRVYKAVVLNDRGRGPVYVVLYTIEDEEDEHEDFKDGQGPNYMFEFFIADPACPGFSTLLKDIKSFNFDTWDTMSFVERIRDGEAPAEHTNILMNNRYVEPAIARWNEENPEEIQVLDETFADWLRS